MRISAAHGNGAANGAQFANQKVWSLPQEFKQVQAAQQPQPQVQIHQHAQPKLVNVGSGYPVMTNVQGYGPIPQQHQFVGVVQPVQVVPQQPVFVQQLPSSRSVKQTPEISTVVIQRLSKLLRSGSDLKSVVRTCFQSAAAGKSGMHVGDLASFRSLASLATKVPEEALGDIHDEFIRFDFDGDGLIEEHEAYKLVKYHFREYLRKLAPDQFRVDVRWVSLREAGYTTCRELGRGSFGILRLATNSSGKQFAIKTITKSCASTGRSMNHEQIEELKEEYAIMRELENTRIARVFDFFQDSQSMHLVGEPYFGKDFTDLIERARAQGVDLMSEQWWRTIFKQCFSGLLHMHRHAMMHCDIKEANIMLKTEDLAHPEIVIIDYGLAQSFTSSKLGISGTPGYIPPETWHAGKWYPKGDCFSMGVTMYQLLTDTVPNGTGQLGLFGTGARMSPPEAAFQDVERFTLTRPVPLSMLPGQYQEVKDLLVRLTNKEQKHRINAEQACKHPWLNRDRVVKADSRGSVVGLQSDARQQRVSKSGSMSAPTSRHITLQPGVVRVQLQQIPLQHATARRSTSFQVTSLRPAQQMPSVQPPRVVSDGSRRKIAQLLSAIQKLPPQQNRVNSPMRNGVWTTR